MFSAWGDEKHATGCIYGHSPHPSSRRELGQKQNWDASLKAQRLKTKPAVTVYAALEPCCAATTQSLPVLAASINDATAGTKLVGNAGTDFTTRPAALTELLAVRASLAHQGWVCFSKIFTTKFNYTSLYENQKTAAVI